LRGDDVKPKKGAVKVSLVLEEGGRD
jgi:hypothetical protein